MTSAFDTLESLCNAASASPASTDKDLPDLSLFGAEVTDFLLNQPDLINTPAMNQTPSLFPCSPDMELIAPVQAQKDLQGTPQLVMTPTIPSPRSLSTGLGLYPGPSLMTGQYGFLQGENGYASDVDANLTGIDFLQTLLDIGPLPPVGTVSPADLFPPFTPGQSQDTPSIGATSPLLATPGRPTIPISASATNSSAGSRRRTSPLQKSQPKRGRSEEEDTDAQSSKRRKHTGTRPGITSQQLIPPGAPPQSKTYLTESSTSRKDIPASYKLKPGESPSDAVVNKIVAKRTANRDSARRSRQRKQAAMEAAQDKINILHERVQQLEEFIRASGFEPPMPLRTLESPKEEPEDLD